MGFCHCPPISVLVTKHWSASLHHWHWEMLPGAWEQGRRCRFPELPHGRIGGIWEDAVNGVFTIPSAGLSPSKEERPSRNQTEALGLPYLSYFTSFALPDAQPYFPTHPHYSPAWFSSLIHFSGHLLCFPAPGSFLQFQSCNLLFLLSGFFHCLDSLCSPSLQTCAVLLPCTSLPFPRLRAWACHTALNTLCL